MSLELKDALLSNYKSVRALGNKVIDADAQLVIDGFENYSIVAKEFPHPAPLTSGEAIESFGPNGQKFLQASNANTAQQGSIVLYCYDDCHNNGQLDAIKNKMGGSFDAVVYDASAEAHLRAYRIRDAFITIETIKPYQENKTQILKLTEQLWYHYLEERVEGKFRTLYGTLEN
ncbi:MAG: hypothetical protein WAU37_00045 [Formosimonas sp.]